MHEVNTEVAIVVPTFDEAENIERTIDGIASVLGEWRWEIIVVDDDSPDQTSEIVRRISQQDPRVRLVHRIGRRGLSSAAIEGFMACTAPIVGLIDADGQHDESILPKMIQRLIHEDCDLVVGSRYSGEGSAEGLSPLRKWVSSFATKLSSLILRGELHDPMSGFFVMRRTFLLSVVRSLSGMGYKILLDIASSAPPSLRIAEEPYHFRKRHSGRSKLDLNVVAEFLLMLLDKRLGSKIPARFILFVLSGGVGAFFHLLLLGSCLHYANLSFVTSQLFASGVAMVVNFMINNWFTYHDRRFRGRQAIRPFTSFILICSVGAATNLIVASRLYENEIPWWFAGLVGSVIGAVWNYAVSSKITWPRHRTQP